MALGHWRGKGPKAGGTLCSEQHGEEKVPEQKEEKRLGDLGRRDNVLYGGVKGPRVQLMGEKGQVSGGSRWGR